MMHFKKGPHGRKQRENKGKAKSVSLLKPSAVSMPDCLSGGVNKLSQSILYGGLTLICDYDKHLHALTRFIYMLITFTPLLFI